MVRSGDRVRIGPDYAGQLADGRLKVAVLAGEVLPVCDVEYWGSKGDVVTFKIDGCQQGIPVEQITLV